MLNSSVNHTLGQLQLKWKEKVRITLRFTLAWLLVARFLSQVLVGGEVLDTFCLRNSFLNSKFLLSDILLLT